MSQRILIVDDDVFLAEGLTRLMSEQGFEVSHAGTASDAWTQLEGGLNDLVLLDLGLPDQDGVLLCRRIRAKWEVPILMLTSRSQAVEKVVGLESGADDYLPKPFDPQELVARVRAILRRTHATVTGPAKFSFGGLVIDEGARAASFETKALDLTETEYKIIAYLAKNAGRAIGREQLFETVWGYELEFNSNSLEVLVYRLRHKLQEAGAGNPIKTLRGYGYKWET